MIDLPHPRDSRRSLRAGCWIALVLIVAAGQLAATTASAAPVELARDGRAQLDVVVAADASDETREHARTLADYLGRISGGTFEVTEGRGARGIAVGVAEDFPGLNLVDEFEITTPANEERYRLRSHSAGVAVIGATDLAVQHAVWDLLYRLGHRQFFPGETWEVVPSEADLRIDVDVTEQPDYVGRRIWYGYGTWGYNDEPLARWRERNRSDGAMVPRTGHAYGSIYRRNEATFDANPAYFAMVDGEREYRGNIKFCLSNTAVRELIVADRLAALAETGQSVSVDPSDGGGWCECEECAAMGSVSDQVVTLANEVAEAAVERFGDAVYVGTYAYNEHSPPPSIDVHPNVIVSIATSFIRGGYTLDELIEGWGARGATLGIREYYSIIMWDSDLPGRARAARPGYLAETIPHFHDHGARFMNAESSDNWGPNGLGYYLANRILWDVSEAERVDERVDDFLERAFGEAREPMEAYYDLINSDERPLMSDDLIGRMYRAIREARSRTDDESVLRRLDDLTLYTHYVELQHRRAEADGGERDAIAEQIIRHSYRMRETMMVHAKALYRRFPRMAGLDVPDHAAWDVPEDENPWKDSTPFSREELDEMLEAGIANHELIDFEPVAFSDDLVPATHLGIIRERPTSEGEARARSGRVYYTWVDRAPADLRLGLQGGLISHYQDRGDVTLELYPRDEVLGQSVAEGVTAPDGERRNFTLTTEYEGLHRIEFHDGGDMTRLYWPAGLPMTFEMSTDQTTNHTGRSRVYFYVPRGTEVVGGHVEGGRGTIRDADDNIVYDFDEQGSGYFHAPVPRGQDGQLWRLESFTGSMRFMTVPPYGAFRPADLLLPREVVAADGR